MKTWKYNMCFFQNYLMSLLVCLSHDVAAAATGQAYFSVSIQ